MSSSFSQFHLDIQFRTILSHDHNFQLGSHCPNEVVKDAPKFHGKGVLRLCYRGATYTKKQIHNQHLTREQQYIALQCAKYNFNLTNLLTETAVSNTFEDGIVFINVKT